jgi:hypothetical protein
MTSRLFTRVAACTKVANAAGPRGVAPSRKGFGTATLLDAARQFGQHVAVGYDPNG